MNKYNNELVFTVHKTALDNALYIFQKYHNSFSKAGAWEVVGFPTVELMNTGVMIKINVVSDGAENEVTYQLFSTPKIQARVVEDVGVKENLTQIYYHIERVYDVQGDVQPEFTTELVDYLNT